MKKIIYERLVNKTFHYTMIIPWTYVVWILAEK